MYMVLQIRFAYAAHKNAVKTWNKHQIGTVSLKLCKKNIARANTVYD